MVRLFSQYVPVRSVVYLSLETLLVLLFLTIQGNAILLGNHPSLGQLLLIPLIYQICFYYGDALGIDIGLSHRDFLMKNVQAVAVSSAVLIAVYTILPTAAVAREFLLPNLLLLPAVLLAARMTYRKVIERGRLAEKILLIGAGKMSGLIQAEIEKNWLGYRVFARSESQVLEHEDICGWVRENHFQRIVLAMADRRGQFPLEALLRLKVNGLEVLDGVTFYERLKGKILIDAVRPGWLIFGDGFRRPKLLRAAKRIFDCVLATVGLILALPIFLIVPLLIKLDSRGPIFLRQTRVGENGREFSLMKFRSMREDAEAKTGPSWAAEKDPRITRIGRILRKLRIDEIPQLINVLKGEMSFVGPRPERPVFVNQLKGKISYYDLRLTVRPGITGWAQVRYQYGSTEVDALEKLQYDLYYIKNLSLRFDLMIMFETAKVVLTGKGAR